MGKLDKIVKRILGRPPDIDFQTIVWLLERFGYDYKIPRRGSHYVFFRADDPDRQFTIPTVKGKRVKRVYIDLVIQELDLEEWNGETNGEKGS